MKQVGDGDVLTDMKFKVPLVALGVADIPTDLKDVVVDIDPEGRALTEFNGVVLMTN